MSMGTHIKGIRPADDKFKKMLAAYRACEAVGIRPPDDVCDFFNGDTPSDNGLLVSLEDHKAVTEYSDDMVSGFDVEIAKLPKDIKIIRFYNSW